MARPSGLLFRIEEATLSAQCTHLDQIRDVIRNPVTPLCFGDAALLVECVRFVQAISRIPYNAEYPWL